MFKERANAVTKITALIQPLVVINPLALEKMMYYVNHCEKEIGWLGTVERFDNEIFYVTDVFLFKQEVHSATCEITPEGLSDFATELLSKENGVDVWNNLKLWGHSHVNMSVSPSAQDNSQMKTFGEHNEWFLRLIANKSGEMEFTLYDFKSNLIFENVRWIEYKDKNKELEEQIKAEIKEKVTEKSYTVNYGYGYNYANYRNKPWWEEEVKKNIKEEKTEIDIKEFEWNEKTIPLYFTEKELKKISAEKTTGDKILMIYDLVEQMLGTIINDDIGFEDACRIIEYAENKYPA